MDAATLKAEAERQAREGLRPGPLKTHCIECEKPFSFGVVTPDNGVNVYSMAGARDTQIIGMCETCFDGEAERVKVEAKQRRAAKKLAQVQKCGPRLLAALDGLVKALDDCSDPEDRLPIPEGPELYAIYEARNESRQAIDQAEAGRVMDAATLKAEAERQAREGLRPGPLKTHCIECEKPFSFGVVTPDNGVNVYSMAGARDTQIIGMCETCFDGMCVEENG